MTEEMTPQNERQYLVELFAKAGKADTKYKTDKERLTYLSETGAQTFKRKVLGLCGYTSIKTLEEIAELLQNTNITSSLEEARELVPKIVAANQSHSHAICRGRLRYLSFDEVENPNGDLKYKITAWTADSS